MSRVTLRTSLLVAIICLSLAGEVFAQSDNGEPVASAIEVTALNVREAAQKTRAETSAAHIEAILDSSLKSPLVYDSQPLNEVIGALQDEYDIPFQFDRSALEAVAISPQTEISIDLNNVTLRSALNLILRQPGLEDLTFVSDDEVILITTQEKANEKIIVEVYRVDDLTWDYQTADRKGSPYSSLIQTITKCVAYDTWMSNGTGEGEIRLLCPGLLVVANTAEVQRKVRALLDDLRVVRTEIDEDRGSRGD